MGIPSINRKMVIINNTAMEAVAIRKKNFRMILGGTHLEFLAPQQIDQSIETLKTMDVERIAVSHCTGMKAAFRLQQEFGERYQYGCVGTMIDF